MSDAALDLDPNSLAARLSPAARPDDPKAAAARVAALAADPALAPLLAAAPAVEVLLAAVADGSPFLWQLAAAAPERLARLLEAPPEATVERLMTAAHGATAAPDEATAMRVLRQARQEMALAVALADIGGAWEVPAVTGALSGFADAALQGALGFVLAEAARGGPFRPQNPADPAAGSGVVVIAMGKAGAGELNYSSDIDLMVFYDPGVAPLAPGIEPAPFFVRATQRLVKLLQERTADGYVFRTDLRLRPDPASTAVAISREAALSYYESVGQNWERAAMLKARPAAGDLALGEALLADLAPFVWRKYLDFGAIADVHAMKRQIHVHRGHGAIAVEGHNVKLGRGGIREIEFFVQTQQLVAGGRNPALRVRGTEAALVRLHDAGWIDAKARDELTEAYRLLRTVEHRLQMVADEQTHTLPADPAALDRFAKFLGFAGRDAFAAVLTGHMERVQGHYARLFEDAPPLAAAGGSLVFTGEEDDPETLGTLSRMGFAEPKMVSALVRGWHHGHIPATRSARARELLTELLPALLDAVGRTAAPDQALRILDRVLARLPAGIEFFSLLRSNPGFLGLLADALGTAPRLGEMVAKRPHVLDALLEPAFFARVPDRAELAARLAAALAEARGYEDLLDRARIFGQEQAVLVGFRVLAGQIGADRAGFAFADLAEAAVDALYRAALAELERAHGRVPGARAAVVALGKLGGREITAASDLDLILIYDHPDEAVLSDGPRPLAPSQYFARLTQRLIAALSAPTAEGRLYEVDMRLRPSGRSGPLATRLAAFEAYQAGEAWTWEHMALTRARPIAGDPAMQAEVAAIVAAVLRRPREPAAVARDVVEMRERLGSEKGEDQPWDLKYAKGGLVDLEFIAQYLELAHAHAHPAILHTGTAAVLQAARAEGLIGEGDWELLGEATRLQHDLTQVLRLCVDGRFEPAEAGAGLRAMLARAGHVPDFATLEALLRDTQAEVRAAFGRLVGGS
ncbi:MAG TPA: bifunctional [glutamine synthetase] adenylyltransferase/[glutamine synthetase]-adenylyl-L-tyrosine phosphorylase [Hyphomicrobiales bacterium]|nr:bifunctional [glutamine synthetase] adenylyltransferase/[glutamine synthetase]-adenylyl-L-tyrosine phosphorylase [Hyphomicrobiales bacterium]